MAINRRDLITTLGILVAKALFLPTNPVEAAMTIGKDGQMIWIDDAGNMHVHESGSHPQYNGKIVSPDKVGLGPEDLDYPEQRMHPNYKGEDVQRKERTSLIKILEQLNVKNVGEDEVKELFNNKYGCRAKNLKTSDFSRDELLYLAQRYENNTLGRINMTIDFANHYEIPVHHIPRVVALFNQESRFDPNAKARGSTATGVTQILKGTAKEYGIKIAKHRVKGQDDRLIDSISIDGGVRIIKDYVAQISDMYWRADDAYKDLDGVYHAGVKNWRRKTYPKYNRKHRWYVSSFISDATKIVKKHQQLRKKRV